SLGLGQCPVGGDDLEDAGRPGRGRPRVGEKISGGGREVGHGYTSALAWRIRGSITLYSRSTKKLMSTKPKAKITTQNSTTRKSRRKIACTVRSPIPGSPKIVSTMPAPPINAPTFTAAAVINENVDGRSAWRNRMRLVDMPLARAMVM